MARKLPLMVVWLVSDGQSNALGGGSPATDQKLTSQSPTKTVHTGLKGGTTYTHDPASGHLRLRLCRSKQIELAGPSSLQYTFVVYGDTRTRHDVQYAQ